MDSEFIFVGLAIFVIAMLYSSVGHGGASGYLAVMAFMAISPDVIRPTALVLNLVVSSIAAFQFYRSGYFSWKLFWPFAAASIPFAFIGGMISLPTNAYRILLGFALAAAALRLVWNFGSDEKQSTEPRLVISLFVGCVIGLLSGIVGVGGGIFLTPILLLSGWSDAKRAAGVSALFIFVNSFAGLAGSVYEGKAISNIAVPWIIFAIAGGLIGSLLGSQQFDSLTIRRLLAAVLITASLKMVLFT